MEYTLLSWNVNGVRAVSGQLLGLLGSSRPWLLAAQETRAAPGDVPAAVTAPEGYRSWWNAGERKGYSGVAAWCREEPLSIAQGFGIERFDS
jgi:exodeoxyribonuclease III